MNESLRLVELYKICNKKKYNWENIHKFQLVRHIDQSLFYERSSSYQRYVYLNFHIFFLLCIFNLFFKLDNPISKTIMVVIIINICLNQFKINYSVFEGRHP